MGNFNFEINVHCEGFSPKAIFTLTYIAKDYFVEFILTKEGLAMLSPTKSLCTESAEV